MTRKPTEITVYWDSQDPRNEGWAYRASDGDGLIDSGSLDTADDDDLCEAIDEACSILDVDLGHDDFAQQRNVDGGHAVWKHGAA